MHGRAVTLSNLTMALTVLERAYQEALSGSGFAFFGRSLLPG